MSCSFLREVGMVIGGYAGTSFDMKCLLRKFGESNLREQKENCKGIFPVKAGEKSRMKTGKTP